MVAVNWNHDCLAGAAIVSRVLMRRLFLCDGDFSRPTRRKAEARVELMKCVALTPTALSSFKHALD